MTTATATLADFLLARISDDEVAARAAQSMRDSDGDLVTFYSTRGAHRDDWGLYTFNVAPARILADCAARRLIIELHVPGGRDSRGATCQACADWTEAAYDVWPEQITYPCPTLRHLAAPYALHPEFDEAWAVS